VEDEVETKLAHIEAVDLYNKKYGTPLEYAPSLKKFKEAYAKGNEAVEAYLNSDKNALNYGFDPRGNKMGVRISGSGDYSYIVLVKAVQGNQFSGFAYTQGGKLILFKK
jgi:hypothetical protein